MITFSFVCVFVTLETNLYLYWYWIFCHVGWPYFYSSPGQTSRLAPDMLFCIFILPEFSELNILLHTRKRRVKRGVEDFHATLLLDATHTEPLGFWDGIMKSGSTLLRWFLKRFCVHVFPQVGVTLLKRQRQALSQRWRKQDRSPPRQQGAAAAGMQDSTSDSMLEMAKQVSIAQTDEATDLPVVLLSLYLGLCKCLLVTTH